MSTKRKADPLDAEKTVVHKTKHSKPEGKKALKSETTKSPQTADKSLLAAEMRMREASLEYEAKKAVKEHKDAKTAAEAAARDEQTKAKLAEVALMKLDAFKEAKKAEKPDAGHTSKGHVKSEACS